MSTSQVTPPTMAASLISGLIDQSKEILGSTPVFAGTRVPVRALFDYLEEGQSLNEFLKDFPRVTSAQAIGVLRLTQLAFDALLYEDSSRRMHSSTSET